MTFTLKIKLGNDAMQTGLDVADALTRIARRIESDDELAPDCGKVMDTNGNSVGNWEVK